MFNRKGAVILWWDLLLNGEVDFLNSSESDSIFWGIISLTSLNPKPACIVGRALTLLMPTVKCTTR